MSLSLFKFPQHIFTVTPQGPTDCFLLGISIVYRIVSLSLFTFIVISCVRACYVTSVMSDSLRPCVP